MYIKGEGREPRVRGSGRIEDHLYMESGDGEEARQERTGKEQSIEKQEED